MTYSAVSGAYPEILQGKFERYLGPCSSRETNGILGCIENIAGHLPVFSGT